jgi:MFS family permease
MDGGKIKQRDKNPRTAPVVEKSPGSIEVIQSHPSARDDMDDSGEIPPREPLRTLVQQCQDCIRPAFTKADKAALMLQRKYRGRATAAAVLGSAAVALAIFQLFLPLFLGREPHWIWLFSVAEGAAALGTFLIVFLGMKATLKEEWLLERFRAENLRLLKFRYLIESALRSHADMPWGDERLCELVEEITGTTYSALRGWLSEGTVPNALEWPASEPSKEFLDDLIMYYRRKRLRSQMAYLSTRIESYQRKDKKTRLFGPAFFFGSVGFVLAHLMVEMGQASAEQSHGSADWSKLLILGAALLPVAAGGLRIHRAANEFARSASRFEAVHYTLRKLSERLREAEGTPQALQELSFCEAVMEGDLREWMRLMVEAEWYG